MTTKLTGDDLETALTERGLPSEGTADEKRAAVAKFDADVAAADASTNPSETRLDEDTSKPSTTAPGDGPADTTDPTEIASTVSPDKAAAAAAGHGTVNGVVPVSQTVAERDTNNDRVETYAAKRPDGTEVQVERNVETGATRLI